jgi:VCBS repeat protein
MIPETVMHWISIRWISRRGRSLAAAVWLFAAGLALTSPAQPWPTYHTREQSVPGRITSCVIQDLNRDGLDDAFVVLGRAWWVFHGSAEGLRPATPKPRAFGPDVATFDVAPGDSPERPILVAYCDERGLVHVKRDLSAWKPGLGFGFTDPTVCRTPAPVHPAPLFYDPLGDGTLAVPCIAGADRVYQAVWRPDGTHPEFPRIRLCAPSDHRLHLTGDGLLDRIVSETQHETGHFGDLNGDGIRDAILVFTTRLVLYRSRAHREFPENPTGVFPLGPQSVGTRLFHAVVPPLLVDLDQDRALDLVDTDANGGLIRVHRGPLDQPAAARPVHRLRFQGPILDVVAMDVNGDGRLDLRVLATEQVSLLSGIHMFLTQHMPVRLLTFCQRPDRSLPVRPDAALDFRLPVAVDTGESPPRAVPVLLVDFVHDLDRDGRPDLIRHLDRRTLGIFPGGKDRGELPSSPEVRLELPGSALTRWDRVQVGDFNGDGRPDVLAAGWTVRQGQGVLATFLSEKP